MSERGRITGSVIVYCAGTARAPHDRYDFELFDIYDSGDLGYGHVALPRRLRAVLIDDERLRDGGDSVGEDIEYIEKFATKRGGEPRIRHSWQCPTCGDHVQLRHEKIDSVLTKLFQNGAPDVSIAVLRRIL